MLRLEEAGRASNADRPPASRVRRHGRSAGPAPGATAEGEGPLVGEVSGPASRDRRGCA